MSAFFELTVNVCQKMHNAISDSLTVRIMLRLFSKIEDLWVSSFFCFLFHKASQYTLKNKSSILERGLFSPMSVVVGFLFFLALTSYSISPLTRSSIILGNLSFTLSYLLTYRIKGLNKPLIFDEDDIMAVGSIMFFVGTFFVFLSIVQVQGMPLLKPSLRYLLSPKLTIPSFLVIPALVLITSSLCQKVNTKKINMERARFRVVILSFLAVFFLVSLGYRTPVLALMLAVIVTGYYTRLFSLMEIVGVSFLAMGFILVLGYYRISAEYFWSYGPAALMEIRANFTLQIYDSLVELCGLTGLMHGKLIQSMIPGSELGPRYLIARLIGWRPGVTITATLLGPMLVDFGVIGVVVGMGILGFILGTGYRLAKSGNALYIGVYALLISYTLIGIETGIIDIIIWFYFFGALLLYAANIILKKP